MFNEWMDMSKYRNLYEMKHRAGFKRTDYFGINLLNSVTCIQRGLPKCPSDTQLCVKYVKVIGGKDRIPAFKKLIIRSVHFYMRMVKKEKIVQGK